jgi:hypothetical protein
MPQSSDQLPTPEQIFLDVQHKVENGHDYSMAEAKIDFQRLFHALGAALRHSGATQARLDAAETLLEEKDIEIFNKDMELFSAITQFDSLKETK